MPLDPEPELELLPEPEELDPEPEPEPDPEPEPVLLGASKLIRAPRPYWGVALSRSFRMCITVEMSRLGRPYRSCSAGLRVPEKVPE